MFNVGDIVKDAHGQVGKVAKIQFDGEVPSLIHVTYEGGMLSTHSPSQLKIIETLVPPPAGEMPQGPSPTREPQGDDTL